MEPPSGLKQESKGTNDDDHTKMDLKYIYGNIFSADFTLDCIHTQPTHISQINNKQSVIYNSNDFSTSNDQILDNKLVICNKFESDFDCCDKFDTEEWITAANQPETKDMKTTKLVKDEMHQKSPQVFYKYTFIPHLQETKNLQMGTFYVHGDDGYVYEFIVDEYGLSLSHNGTEFNLDATVVTIDQLYNATWGNDFCNKFFCNMNYVRSSYKTSEELEHEAQEQNARRSELLNQITNFNSKPNAKQQPSTSALSNLALTVTPSPNSTKFLPGVSVATIMKENMSRRSQRPKKDVDYRQLNMGKSPVKRQTLKGKSLQNESLSLQKESLIWDTTCDPWNTLQPHNTNLATPHDTSDLENPQNGNNDINQADDHDHNHGVAQDDNGIHIEILNVQNEENQDENDPNSENGLNNDNHDEDGHDGSANASNGILQDTIFNNEIVDSDEDIRHDVEETPLSHYTGMPKSILKDKTTNPIPPNEKHIKWGGGIAQVHMITTSVSTQHTNTLTNAIPTLNQQQANFQITNTANNSGGGIGQNYGIDPNLQMLTKIMEQLSMNQTQQMSTILQQQAQLFNNIQRQTLTTISGSIRDAVSSTSSSLTKATQLANFDKLPILKGRESLYEVKTFFHRFETFAQGQSHNESLNILQTKLKGYALHVFEEAVNEHGNNFDEVKGYLLNKLGQNDLKRESYFHQLTNGVIRKEKEPFTDFGQRIYDMTNTVFMGYSNIE